MELEETRRREAEKRANENGQIVMKQPDGSEKKISPTEMVSIVKQQQVQYKNLQQQFGNIKSLYLSAFDERTSPQFGQTGVAFFMAVQVRKASVFMVVLYGVTM